MIKSTKLSTKDVLIHAGLFLIYKPLKTLLDQQSSKIAPYSLPIANPHEGTYCLHPLGAKAFV